MPSNGEDTHQHRHPAGSSLFDALNAMVAASLSADRAVDKMKDKLEAGHRGIYSQLQESLAKLPPIAEANEDEAVLAVILHRHARWIAKQVAAVSRDQDIKHEYNARRLEHLAATERWMARAAAAMSPVPTPAPQEPPVPG